MRRCLIGIALALAALPALAAAEDDIVLRGMGSFHVGGRIAEVSGKPVRQIQRVPGGPLTKLDPNGAVHGRADVRAVLPAEEPQGQVSAADVARRRAHRRHLRVDARRPRRLAQPVRPQGLGHLRLGRGRARPLRLRQRRTSGRASRSSSTTRTRSSASASATAKAPGMPIRPSASCCPATSSRSRPTTTT